MTRVPPHRPDRCSLSRLRPVPPGTADRRMMAYERVWAWATPQERAAFHRANCLRQERIGDAARVQNLRTQIGAELGIYTMFQLMAEFPAARWSITDNPEVHASLDKHAPLAKVILGDRLRKKGPADLIPELRPARQLPPRAALTEQPLHRGLHISPLPIDVTPVPVAPVAPAPGHREPPVGQLEQPHVPPRHGAPRPVPPSGDQPAGHPPRVPASTYAAECGNAARWPRRMKTGTAPPVPVTPSRDARRGPRDKSGGLVWGGGPYPSPVGTRPRITEL